MIGLHIRLLVFQVTAVSMSTQKQLTFKISNLQLFKLSINNSSPFPVWCWFRNCAEKDAQDNIYMYIKIRNKKEVSLMKNSDILGLNWPFQTLKTFFATLHHPFVLNKLTPKSWVANGFPISFQTLILEKFMLHQYFKQHYMYQKFKKEISNLSYQVQGSWKGNLEVFTKWKRKWVGHIHFRRQIRLHNAS